tara:strand:+ start:255 stop:1802 length:1548 start_codon:yes stop_codon:yes gene_type:complete
MCGILVCYGKPLPRLDFLTLLEKLDHRGPDKLVYTYGSNTQFGFCRLAINGTTTNISDQPFDNDTHTLVCNGEVFNYESLAIANELDSVFSSDCEVILPLMRKYPFNVVCDKMDAEFAMVIHDKKNDRLLVARDRYGVRPLFVARSADDSRICFASEAKALIHSDLCEVRQVTPGVCSLYRYVEGKVYLESEVTYNQELDIPNVISDSYESVRNSVRTLLCEAVGKRILMTDRPACCLLSGGLDSSLVSALAAKTYDRFGKTLHTFSIGLKGSPDLAAAKKVSDHIKSHHTSVEVSEDDFINAIPDVISSIESYDTTTVRASVGNYLIAKYIAENTDFKVILNGDYADEVCGGYLYINKAPTRYDFHMECKRLLKDIHYYDSLRSDRTICAHGLEARAPFADKAFVSYYLSLSTNVSSPLDKCEKWLLRDAFSDSGILPDEILWRKKEAFSDGVSDVKRSWHSIIKEKFGDEDAYYKDIFIKNFGEERLNLIPYKWLPKFCGDVTDPSARELTFY